MPSDRPEVGRKKPIDGAIAARAFSRLVSPPLSLTQVELAGEVDLARALFREYEASLKVDLCFQSFEAELSALPAPYVPPRGALLIAKQGDRVAGCGAFRPWSADACELKRMFLRPEFRGQGSGRKLAEMLIDRAREAGFRSMRLDTLDFMREAVALYQSLGFKRIERYYNNPHPGALFFELDLR
jgi:GNAT superfamily N-acetyltransferase